ncbi:hypothetical protein J4558_18935 [Leptolyngbya sp. 15MV]|nr:hypothetical protein J4558_18935 [Leptolyngbya sp. 15MV]
MIRNRTALKFPDRQTSLLLMTMALGIGWLLVMLARSPGALLDDEITHYLISLNAWRYWEALLDVWGRPGNTFAYMFPAMIGGLEGRRLFAIALTALTALLTAQIGERLGIQRRWWIAVCFFFPGREGSSARAAEGRTAPAPRPAMMARRDVCQTCMPFLLDRRFRPHAVVGQARVALGASEEANGDRRDAAAAWRRWAGAGTISNQAAAGACAVRSAR